MVSVLKRIVPKKVKTKLLLILGVLISLTVAVPSFLSYRATLSNTNQKLERELTTTISAVNKRISNEKAEQLRLLAYTVAGMPSIQDNVQFQSRDDLQTVTGPLYEQLKKIIDLNVFHFHTPPATSFLRLQKPEKFGDDLSSFRKTVVQVNKEKKDASGIEVGVAGISVRAVVPVMYLGRKHAGSVEFGAPLNDALLHEIKKTIGLDISLIIPEGSGFKYQAKTHNLTIPEKKYPFLAGVMEGAEIKVKRVSKDNKELMTAYMPISDYSGTPVGILAIPKDIGEILSTARKGALISVLEGMVALVVILILVYMLFTRLIDRPMQKIIRLLESASRGDLTQDVNMDSILPVNCSEIMQCNKPECSMYGKEGYCWEEAGSAASMVQCPKITSGEYTSCSECKGVFRTAVTDEFSELTTYMHAFLANIRSLVKDVNNNCNNLNNSAESLADLSQKIDRGSNESAGRTETVATAAEEMSSNMNSVAAATEEAAANLNVMTTATEEINTTVGEIQQSTANAKEITGDAVVQASDISGKVDELGNAAQDIGKVTETITDISAQTNLLALNATIEAARAGEAGKGFAVVANEIKDLARQTAEATGEIKQRIEGIQSSTETTVTGIKKISDIILEIDTIVSSIATSLEEQSATMTELSTNIVQAGEGIGEVSENVAQSSSVSDQISADIAGVNNAVKDISTDIGNVRENADELRMLSQTLKQLIEKFQL